MESIPKQHVREHPTDFVALSIWNPDRRAMARESLLRWEGTPHRDRIAMVGIGIDCINLVYRVLFESKVLEEAQFGGYDLQDGLHRLSDRLVRVMQHVTFSDILDPEKEQPEFGDVLIFKTGVRSGHCGFYADENVWHSLSKQSVIWHPYKAWEREIQAICRIRAIGWRNPPRTAIKL